MNTISTLKTAGLAVALFMGVQSAQAAEPYDIGVMEPGVTYNFPQYTQITGQYTPTQTGKVRILYSTTPLALYSSPNHEEASIVDADHSYTSEGQMMSYPNLEGGKTYYIYSPMSMGAGTLIIYEGSQELKVVDTTPSLDETSPNYYGGKFSVSDNYRINVKFNFPVSVRSSAQIIVGDARSTVIATATGANVSVDVASQIMELYRSGALKEGDEMTLRLFSVADALDSSALFGGTGIVDIKFIAAAKPVELVRITNANRNGTNILNSYYFENDPAAVVTFEFDGELSTEKLSEVTFTYGNPDNLDVGVYTETIKGANDGKSAIFDFAGKLRRPIDMLPASTTDTQPEYLFASFGNIYSKDGQRAYTGMMSNPSGYGLSYKINTLQYTIAADYTPARNSQIFPGKDLEIWVMNGNQIKFDAIRFEYVKGGAPAFATVDAADVKSEDDPLSDGAVIYTLTVPEMEFDKGTKVKLSFDNLICADGINHSDDLNAEFLSEPLGIDGIEAGAEAESYEVYNAAGIRVLSGATRGEVASLPAGLYIINGQKTLIRK